MSITDEARSGDRGCLWPLGVGVLAVFAIGLVVGTIFVATGGVQLHTRAGAGADQSQTVPFDRCATAPQQAEAGVRALLVNDADISDAVVFQSSKFPGLIVVAARVGRAPDKLTRAGIGEGGPAVWAYDSGIAADAHATEFVSSQMSKRRRQLALPPELTTEAVGCLTR